MDMMKILKKKPSLLDEEIALVREELHSEVDIDRKKDIFERYVTLLKMKNDEKKTKNDRAEFWVKIALEAAAIGLPLYCYNCWYHEGLDFEKEGTFSSQFMKGLMRFFKPTRH